MIFIGESFSIFEITTLSLQLVLTIFFLRNKMANQCRHRPMMNFVFVVKTSSQLFNGVTMTSHKDGTALGLFEKSKLVLWRP